MKCIYDFSTLRTKNSLLFIYWLISNFRKWNLSTYVAWKEQLWNIICLINKVFTTIVLYSSLQEGLQKSVCRLFVREEWGHSEDSQICLSPSLCTFSPMYRNVTFLEKPFLISKLLINQKKEILTVVSYFPHIIFNFKCSSFISHIFI